LAYRQDIGGQLRNSAHQSGEGVALRLTAFRIPTSRRFIRKISFDLLFASLIAAADLGEGGTVFLMDGDQEPLRVEAMHLDEPSPSAAAP
jgi:hypothetical protein